MVQPTASSTAGSPAPPTRRTVPWTYPMITGLLGLALSWGALRLDIGTPADLALLTGAVILFGAISELIQAMVIPAGRLVHGLLCAAFAVMTALIPLQSPVSFGWLAGLVGAYLMIKGAADVGRSLTTHLPHPARGLLLATGIAGLLLGFAAAGRLVQSAYPLLLIISGLALVRAISDVATACRLRELPGGGSTEAPQDPAVTPGYAAGWADFATSRRLDTAGAGRHSAEERDETAASSMAAGSAELVTAGTRSVTAGGARSGDSAREVAADAGNRLASNSAAGTEPGRSPTTARGGPPSPGTRPARSTTATTGSGPTTGSTATRAGPAAGGSASGGTPGGKGARGGTPAGSATPNASTAGGATPGTRPSPSGAAGPSGTGSRRRSDGATRRRSDSDG